MTPISGPFLKLRKQIGADCFELGYGRRDIPNRGLLPYPRAWAAERSPFHKGREAHGRTRIIWYYLKVALSSLGCGSRCRSASEDLIIPTKVLNFNRSTNLARGQRVLQTKNPRVHKVLLESSRASVLFRSICIFLEQLYALLSHSAYSTTFKL